MAQFQKRKEISQAEEKLLAVQQIVWEAQAKAIAKKEKEANELFQQALGMIQEIKNSPIAYKANKIENEIKEKLIKLNHLEIISQPKILFEIENKDIKPDILSRVGDTLYLADTKKPNLIFFNLNTKEQSIQSLEKPLPMFVQVGEQLVFYDKEKQQLLVPDAPSVNLFPPAIPFDPIDMASFGSSIYFLDAKRGQIFKYQYLPNQQQLIPMPWLKTAFDIRLRQGISMAIDGNIWILDSEGSIHQFRSGKWQKTLKLSVWPKLEKPTKILAKPNIPYLVTVSYTHLRDR